MIYSELPSIPFCQETKMRAEENNNFDEIIKITRQIRAYNQISITELMEGYYIQRSTASSEVNHDFLSIDHNISPNPTIDKDNHCSQAFKQQSNSNMVETYNTHHKFTKDVLDFDSWVPYLEELVKSHDIKAKYLEFFITLIQPFYAKIQNSEASLKEAHGILSSTTESMHQFEAEYQKARHEIDLLHEQLQAKEREINGLVHEKQYWHEQYEIQKLQCERHSILAEKIDEISHNNTQQNSSINQGVNNSITEETNFEVQNLQKLIREKNQKIEGLEKVNENTRIANRLLERELIKMGETVMKLEIECEDLKNQNEILGEEIQELYNDHLSCSHKSSKRYQIHNYDGFHQNHLEYCYKIEEDHEEGSNVFEKTRLLMVEQAGLKGNRISDQIRNLSASSSKSSLLSFKEGNIKHNVSDFAYRHRQIYDIEGLPESHDTLYSSQPNIPHLNLNSSQGILRKPERASETSNFMKKSVIETLKTDMIEQNNNKIDQLLHSIVLRRIDQKLNKNKNLKSENKRSLTERLIDNGWTDRIVKNRIRRKSPTQKTKMSNFQIKNGSDHVKNNFESPQQGLECQLRKNPKMAQSMILPNSASPTKKDKRNSVVNFLMGAVVRNRIKK